MELSGSESKREVMGSHGRNLFYLAQQFQAYLSYAREGGGQSKRPLPEFSFFGRFVLVNPL